MRIRNISVPVTDQERSKAFYRDVLGFEIRSETPFGPDTKWIEMASPADDTSITLVTWFESMPPGSQKGLVMATSDIHQAYRELQARGLKWDGHPRQEPWGLYATFSDPDGNSWTVSQATGS